MQWEKAAVDVIEVAVHSKRDQDDIAVFLEGKASHCASLLELCFITRQLQNGFGFWHKRIIEIKVLH